jgi:hypothetical protein
MAHGFGGVPVEAEVDAGDAKVGGDSQLLAGAGTEQGAIVADAEGKGPVGPFGCAAADLANQGKFASGGVGGGIGGTGRHSLRIGHQRGYGTENGEEGIEKRKPCNEELSLGQQDCKMGTGLILWWDWSIEPFYERIRALERISTRNFRHHFVDPASGVLVTLTNVTDQDPSG